MIEEKATIVETDGEFAWVETQKQSTCSACQVNKACGTSLLHQVLGQKRARLQVLNPAHHQVGDEVVLGLQESALIKGSLLLYVLPLVFMFSFAALGAGAFFLYGLQYTEGFKILFSLTGLAIGFIWISRSNKKISNDPNFQAAILSKSETPNTIISFN